MTLTFGTTKPLAARLEFTQGDRMRKLLEAGELSVGGMADYLGVTRQTVGTWLNDRIAPSRSMILLWSEIFGVSTQWIETGVWTDSEVDAYAAMRAHDEEEAESRLRESNSRPSHYE